MILFTHHNCQDNLRDRARPLAALLQQRQRKNIFIIRTAATIGKLIDRTTRVLFPLLPANACIKFQMEIRRKYFKNNATTHLNHLLARIVNLYNQKRKQDMVSISIN
jgi:hypothetical protein